ncbi:cobalt-precorrin-6A reductase [Calidifontibacter terrae]
MTILILGGTAEARALAAALDGERVISSLAGRVSNPRLPSGEVRIGGFGGAAGLAAYLEEQNISALVDATHPFAVGITANAATAAEVQGVPAIRLARPGWADHPYADSWVWVPDLDAARDAAERIGGRPFLTTGRQSLPSFALWRDRPVLVRVVEPLTDAPEAWTVILDRGPYDDAQERELLRDHAVGVLLTKDSGGSYTAAKLSAARATRVPVVVVQRPSVPSGLPEVASVAEAVNFVRSAG